MKHELSLRVAPTGGPGKKRAGSYKTIGDLKMIKKRMTAATIAVALTLFAGASQAAYQDIAVNGGFETGDFTGWTLFPGSLGAAGQQITSVNPSSGTYAANLIEPNPAANIIKQANLLPGGWSVGQQVDVSFDIRGSATAGGVFFAEAFSELTGGGTSKAEILGGGPLFPNGDSSVWTNYMFSFTTGSDTSGGITLQFNAACGAEAGCVSDYFIDNVTISADVAAVPVPAAVWLFGSALGLLGWTRRKSTA
jgi:hypothetical protein